MNPFNWLVLRIVSHRPGPAAPNSLKINRSNKARNSLMRAKPIRPHRKQALSSRPKTRVPSLEPLEERDLLNGTPLVNALSSTAQLYVEGIFESLLQRSADDAGLTYWSSALQQGLPIDRFVAAIENSAEYSAQIVDQLYATVLQRPASDSDRAYWIDFLDRGGAIEQMEAAFLGSPEFSA